MALDKNILGTALFNVAQNYNDVGVDTTNAAAMDAYRQQFWTDVADTIINHFKINGVLTVPGTGLVAPSGGGPVTGTSVTGKIS
ncbi:MAG: hypothetical protein EKK39_14250 [Sphingobacteriales bacterium]|nr:MAG: hypothetical protein EKK39_14250 [Sphingobacteriales bacterium]